MYLTARNNVDAVQFKPVIYWFKAQLFDSKHHIAIQIYRLPCYWSKKTCGGQQGLS